MSYIFHGSPVEYEIGQLKRTILIKFGKKIYDDISYHISPYLYVALSYLTKSGDKSVNLWNPDYTIKICGKNRADFDKIYGKGG